MDGDREIFQCSCCGNISKVNENYRPRGDTTYIVLWCERCEEYTEQLYCGDDVDDIYELYDLNVDSKYYKYKTE